MSRKFVIFYVSTIASVLVLSILANYLFPYNRGHQLGHFKFTWEPDSQTVLDGTFKLDTVINWDGENTTIVVEANDDEYDPWDYVGLVFDTDQNGYITKKDTAYGLWANNLSAPSVLVENTGFLMFAEIMPQHGPQEVKFTPNSGYMFTIQFPYYWFGSLLWDPLPSLKAGKHPMHICFHDTSDGGVFTQFDLFIP